MFIFYTELSKRDVIDRHGRWAGWPADFLCTMEGPYPALSGLVVRIGRVRRRYALVPWSQVHGGTYQGRPAFQLRVPLESLAYTRETPPHSESSLRHHILDQQVVDVYHRRVVRVNDVHLLQVNGDFRIAHVDVGLRGMVRRLGWEKWMDRLMRVVHPHSRYLTREGFIAWKYVQPLQINPTAGTLAITVAQDDIKAIPPADLSEMLVELDPYQRVALFKSLDPQIQGEILGELDQRFRAELIAELDTKTAVAVLERMPPDEATDVLQSVPRRDADRFLGEMGSSQAQKLSQLLAHHHNTAGGLMTTNFITLPTGSTVNEAIERIKSLTGVAETIYYAYVVDEAGKLEGVVNFRALLVEPMERPIKEIMDARPATVRVTDSAKEVAFLLDKYNFFAIPVLDERGVLQGIITMDDVLSLVIQAAWGEKSGIM